MPTAKRMREGFVILVVNDGDFDDSDDDSDDDGDGDDFDDDGGDDDDGGEMMIQVICLSEARPQHQTEYSQSDVILHRLHPITILVTE